jgi:hypothetical protein
MVLDEGKPEPLVANDPQPLIPTFACAPTYRIASLALRKTASRVVRL